jgi:hypothetical protein
LGITHKEIRQQRESNPGTSLKTSASALLIEVVDWDGASQDIEQVLTTIFQADDYLDIITNLGAQGVDPVSYIDNLDKVGSHSTPKRHT